MQLDCVFITANADFLVGQHHPESGSDADKIPGSSPGGDRPID
jgi:hypothetical protein